MFRFDRIAFLIAFSLLVIEVCIALFVRDRFIRPYVGDVLVVMLIFFGVRTVTPLRPLPLAAGVLVFAFVVEITQGLGLIGRLGLENSTAAKLMLGNTFQWGDLLCYVLGTISSLAIVRMRGTEKR